MIQELLDQEAERALLGIVLRNPATLRGLLVDERFGPEHFYWTQHATAFEALVSICDRGERPDELTFRAELERGGFNEPRMFVAAVASEAMDAPSPRPFARQLRDLHRRRQLQLAGLLLTEAAQQDDSDKLAAAEQILTAPDEAQESTWSGEQLAERFEKRWDQAVPEAFSWPFAKLNSWTGGGLRRKQVVLIGGWTGNGKSVLYDQILEKLAEQGLRCHSYINEMSEEERTDRTVARLSGVDFPKVHARQLDAEEAKQVRWCLSRIRVGLTECAGWSAQEIARHIRWNRWDVAGVDIVHEIAHREERDLAEIAQVLRSTAKSVGCALIACVHLNDNRVSSPQRPMPVLRDVRGSGMLVRGADVVLLVHRDDDKDGVPTNDGVLLAPKIRQGQPDAMGVRFDPARMRFLPAVGG